MWLIVGSQFIMANQAAAKHLGYGSVKALTRLHPSALSPETQPDGQTSRDKAEQMMSIAYREGYHRSNGHTASGMVPVPCRGIADQDPYEGGDALFCIWRDTTEINAAYRSLEERPPISMAFSAHSEKVAIIATDADGRIRYYSPRRRNCSTCPRTRHSAPR